MIFDILDLLLLDLAEKAGLTQNTIYKVENGKFSVGIDVLGKIVEALGRKIDII